MRITFENRQAMDDSESSNSSNAGDTPPRGGRESCGSSVSSTLRQEYEDLLRYAVVTPLVPALQAGGSGGLAARHVPPPPPPPPGTADRGGLSTENIEEEAPSSPTHSPEPPSLLQPHTSQPHPSQPHPSQPHPSLPHPSQSHHSQSHPLQLHPSQPTPQAKPPSFPSSPSTSSSSPVPPYATHGAVAGLGATASQGARGIKERAEEQREGYHAKSHHQSGEIIEGGMDVEAARLSSQLDGWCLDLKRNVLAEFEQSRLRLLDRQRAELHEERQRHAHLLGQAQEELERCKELMATYEQTITRKDHIITSLTRGLQKQKERLELQRSFSAWKLKLSDEKRELFVSSLAALHHRRKLKCKVWGAWFGMIQCRWRQRAEKACQVQAEKVCLQITNEYEERLAASQRSVEASQQEVLQLRTQRDLYEQSMKKAFMRGVCALNLEAMSMFRHAPLDEVAAGHHPHPHAALSCDAGQIDSRPGHSQAQNGVATTDEWAVRDGEAVCADHDVTSSKVATSSGIGGGPLTVAGLPGSGPCLPHGHAPLPHPPPHTHHPPPHTRQTAVQLSAVTAPTPTPPHSHHGTVRGGRGHRAGRRPVLPVLVQRHGT